MTSRASLILVGLVTVPVVSAVVQRRATAGRRWRSVTIASAAFEPTESQILRPLLRALDLRTVSAGPHGTELHGRPRHMFSATPEQVRTALREAKQLAETGEVLRADPRSHGRRKQSVVGSVQDLVERRARGLGLL